MLFGVYRGHLRPRLVVEFSSSTLQFSTGRGKAMPSSPAETADSYRHSRLSSTAHEIGYASVFSGVSGLLLGHRIGCHRIHLMGAN